MTQNEQTPARVPLLEWSASDLDLFAVPKQTHLPKGWYVWLFGLILALSGIYVLERLAMDGALLRLVKKTKLEPSSDFSVPLSALRESSLEILLEEPDGRAKRRRPIELSRALLLDDAATLGTYVRQRAVLAKDKESLRDLERDLSLLMRQVRIDVVNSDWASASKLVSIAGRLLDAYDPPPTNGSWWALTSDVNAVLLLRALFHDIEFAYSRPTAFGTLAKLFSGAADEESVASLMATTDPLSQKWATFFSAKKALSQHDFDGAEQLFVRSAAETDGNLFLQELSLISAGRAAYWKAWNGAPRDAAVARLLQLRSRFKPESTLLNDIDFYLNDLKRMPQ